MAGKKNKPAVAIVAPSRKPNIKKIAGTGLPSLDDITPARYAKLNSRQRKELTLKLIEFLKSI